MRPIPLTIINGFLGSGKTTILRQLLTSAHQRNISLGVIVNDMSALDVDGVLIANTDVVSEAAHNLVTISDENISSAAGLARFADALATLTQADKRPQWIILETSGRTHPLPLVQFLRQQPHVQLRGLFAVVDSLMLERDYQQAQTLIPHLQQNLAIGQRDRVNLLCEQIMFSSQLLLSKTDLLSAQQVQSIAQAIHPLNPYINIMAVSKGHLAIEQLLNSPDYDYQRVEQLIDELTPEIDETLERSPSSTNQHAWVAEVIEDDRPFHPQRLYDTCQSHLSADVYRSKGFFYLPSRADKALLWNQAAGRISLELISYWRSGVLEAIGDQLTPIEQMTLREQIAAKSSRFGDRRCQLTIIGEASAVAQFTRALKQCFLTEDEIAAWHRGVPFIDPWPQHLVRWH